MKSTIRIAILALLALAAPMALAQGGPSGAELNRIVGGMLDDVAAQEMTPEDEAIAHYQQGVVLAQRAIDLQGKLAELDGVKREKAEKKVAKAFDGALQEFELATSKDPAMLDAWAGLGWAQRRTGRWAEAIATYDQALKLAPRFAEALEGRGEALLALNRLEEARATYERLAGEDGKNAATLLSVMENWVRLQKQAGHTETPAVQEMAEFVLSMRAAIGS